MYLVSHVTTHTRPYLQLQRQGEALCSTVEAPGSLSQAVEGRHLVLGAEACPGHQGARAQQHMVATSTRKRRVNDYGRFKIYIHLALDIHKVT